MKTFQPVATLVALSLWSPSVVLAADQAEEAIGDNRHFDGLYVGGQIGIDRLSAKIHTSTEDDSSFNYDVLIGYRHQNSNDWVFAIEGLIGDRTGAIRSGDHVFKFSQIWGFAASVGISFGQYKINLIYGKFGVGGIKVAASVDGVASGSQNFEGPVSSIGYERRLSDRLSIRAEVSYSSYDPSLYQWQPKFGFLVKF